MNAKLIIQNKWVKNTLLVLSGLILGWLLFYPSSSTDQLPDENAPIEVAEAQITWTCSMHPQIRLDKPGACPLCGMDLIPLEMNHADIDDNAISLSEAAMKLAEVQTALVSRSIATREIRLLGKVQADERLIQSQAVHVPGRIDKLLVNYTGETIRKGQLIATVYSPDLIAAQKELIEALSIQDRYPNLVEAARNKLRNWKLTEDQIQKIEMSKSITNSFNIYSNTSGVIMNRKVNEGDYVSTGTILYEVANLSSVWGVFEAYESDLPWISMDQEIRFSTRTQPGETYRGKISFIDPVIDPVTRIAKVRIDIQNSELKLKPGIFIDGILVSNLNSNSGEIIVPQSAILWTGKRSIVYVKLPDTHHPTFQLREISLGPVMQDSYVVLEGLEEGEEIVVNGTFSVDAAAQLQGKRSMLNNGIVSQTETNNTAASKNRIPETFRSGLGEIYHAYIELKESLVASSFTSANKTSGKILLSIKNVNMNGLQQDDGRKWLEWLEELDKNSRIIEASADIILQRQAFSALTQSLTSSIRYFGLNNDKVYYQYCPMAFNNKGDYWLSDTEEIRNPYFGDEMLTCGNVEEVFDFKNGHENTNNH